MKLIGSILFILYSSCLFGQQMGPYETDTIIRLRKKVYRYCFDFAGGKQGFYWTRNDQLSYLSTFQFSVKNSSSDQIVVEKISDGNSVVKLKPFGKLPALIQPQDTFKLVASVQTNEEHIDVPIRIFYRRNGISDSLIIPTWQDEMRSHLLRIYRRNQDISYQCRVYAEINGRWEPLQINDSIRGYVFFVVHAPQDAPVKVKIDTGEPEMIETRIFTSRGVNGYIYYELDIPQDYVPGSFIWKRIYPSKNEYGLITKKWNSITGYPTYLDSVQKILNRSSVKLFDKEKMILTIPDQQTALSLDRQLRNSGLDAKLLPVVDATQLLEDQVTVFFTSGASPDQIIALFRQAGIPSYFKSTPTESEKQAYGNAQKYVIRLTTVIGTAYQKPLRILWNSPLVKLLTQDTFRNPFLPDKPDQM